MPVAGTADPEAEAADEADWRTSQVDQSANWQPCSSRIVSSSEHFAIFFLVPLGLTFATWANYGFRMHGGEGPGRVAGLFLFIGLPSGLISLALFLSGGRFYGLAGTRASARRP